MGAQDLLDSFYAINNLVTIEITMDATQWTNVILTAKPKDVPPPKSDGTVTGRHYEWATAASVTISGSKFPKKKATFTNVGVIKKSFWGSLSFTKPSIKLDFTRFNAANEGPIKDLIGTDYLTLNNAKQDPAYVRQPLGYELFRQADVPTFRCNFASVSINGKFWGGQDGDREEGTPDPRSPPADGIYVNLESMKKKFLENRFNNDQGNAYEISNPDDFDPDRLAQGWMSFEGFSDHKNRKDLLGAAKEIKDHGIPGAKRILGWDTYIKFLATEALIRHWDGYDWNQNNTYIYNDTKAKADPDPKKNDVNFKFIPSGLDQVLGNDVGIKWDNDPKSILAKMVFADKDARAELSDRVRKLATEVYGEKNLDKVVYPFLGKGLDVLKAAKASLKAEDVDVVKFQLANIQKWAYEKVGAPKK